MLKLRYAPNRVTLIAFILLLAFALRILYLTQDRFHADEALYAGWALRILDGDPLLLGVPVDKPPLFLYALAGVFAAFGSSEVAARWINLVCSMVSISLIYRFSVTSSLQAWPSLGRDETRSVAIWAALFLALSPFDILFARTAFTDSMLVMWMLASLCAVADMRWFWSGCYAGLAFATKQHAVVLLPLLIAAAVLQAVYRQSAGLNPQGSQEGSLVPQRHPGRPCIDPPSPSASGLVWLSVPIAALGFLVPWSLVTWWDSARWQIRPGYWQQAALSYGGLIVSSLGKWPERLRGWLHWGRYLTGSALLGTLLVLGVVVLLFWEWRRHPRTRQTWFDTLWAAFASAYFLFHVVVDFAIWDRYLLPLVVPVALLSARVVTLLDPALPGARQIVLPLLIIACLACAVQAAMNGYPIGGEHWAYQGLDQVAAYLRQNAAPDAVLYHHWLRWHYTYYLRGTDFELRWWQDGEHLRQEARKSPDREQYIVLPDWRPLDPSVDGVRFVPLLETRRADGSVSLQLCRVELEPW